MRKQKDYYKCVGIKDGCLYMVDYTFEDTIDNQPFNGVTGTVFSPCDQQYINERNDIENIMSDYKDLWKENVKYDHTEKGLEDFAQEIIDSTEGEFFGQDMSDIDKIPEEIISEYFSDAVTFECIGGGRCFSHNMKFDIVLDQQLLDEINRLED